MEKLIQILNEYWATHEATEEDGGLMFFDEYADNKGHDLMTEVWDKCFIGSSWNPEALAALHENDYITRTFERDSFGILVAGIGKSGKWLSIG